MKAKTSLLLLEILFIPLYILYLFLVTTYLTLFILPDRYLFLIVSYNADWTILLWIILLLPFFAFFLYLKRRKSEKIPLVSTVAAITVGLMISESSIGVLSAYYFNSENHTLEIQATNYDILPYLENGVACQKIVYLPTQNHVKNLLVQQSKDNTLLTETALQAMRDSDFAYLLLPEVPLPGTSTLIQNTLYVTAIDHTLYSQAGMALAQKLAACTFPKVTSAQLPQYSFLPTEQYQEIRKAEILEDIKQVNALIHELDTEIKEYEAWLKQGWAYYNRTKSGEMLRYIKQAEKDIALLKQYKNEYVQWKDTLSDSSDGVIQESGVFIAPNKVHVEYIDYNPEYYADHMVSTMLHEYFHYYSHNETKYLPNFFTEGLTEIINIDTKLANGIAVEHHTYGSEVYLLRKMITDVGYKNMIAVYYAKDEVQLQKLLDTAYGKDFYKNSKSTFELISTLPINEAYSAINAVLEKMGKPTISKEDILAYRGYDLPFTELGE